MKLALEQKFKSLEPFSIELPDFTVLTGVNGAGKTQLLEAIDRNLLKVYDENNAELRQKKYHPAQSLDPNNSHEVTSQDVKTNPEQLWRIYKASKENIRAWEHGYNKKEYKIISKIATLLNKDIEQLTSNDFFNYYPLETGLSEKDIFHQNFASLFKRYQDKFDDNRYNQYRNESLKEEIPFLTKKEFEKAFGEAPWDFANKVLKEAHLNYYVNSPKNDHRDVAFELKLINNDNGAEVNFSDLSSGEKVLMSLALALYNSNFDVEFPKVLLMDEPDASLHPSMSKQFLDVIQKVFVNEKKVKVIITTHSASTVALAPNESIFIMNRTGVSRIEKVSKDKALKVLTSGVPSFSVNYENRRQVFVESPNDVTYYDKLYQLLSDYLIPEISLSFISSGESGTDKNGTKISNCDQVRNITETLREAGNKFVSGIIDWDSKNTSTESVKVLGNGNRYSIENYIFDPLLIGALLLREKLVFKEELNLTPNETYTDLKNFNREKLQFIANFVIDKVLFFVKPKNNDLKKVKLLNGIEIEIPLWYLHHQGHDLEEKILKVFPKLNKIKRDKEDALKKEILNKVADDLVNILSYDILEVLQSVQTS